MSAKTELSKASKDSPRYWQDRIFKPVSQRADGTRSESRDYNMKISHAKRSGYFNLGSSDKATAARKAAEIFVFLRANGWDESNAKFKIQAASPSLSQDGGMAIGRFLHEAARRIDVGKSALAAYSQALRQIAAGIAGMPRCPRQFCAGHDEWRAKVDEMPLSVLSAEKIEQWRRDFVASRKGGPEDERRARVTANAILRNAKSLFKPDLLASVAPGMTSPFDGIKLLKAPIRTYRSKIDAENVLQRAQSELQGDEWLVLAVLAFTGLRRKELDVLMWDQVNLRQAYIDICHTKHFKPKRESSVGRVPLAPDILAVLAEARERQPEAEFVLNGVKPRATNGSRHYRADATEKAVIKWLRSYDNGEGAKPFAECQKPLHELRKEVGALIATRHGIFAAKTILRHANIATTSAYYADQKEAVTVGISLRQPSDKSATS